MATPPTVLASAASSSSPAAASPQAAKFPIIPLVAAVLGSVFAAAAAMGGGMYYLIRSGRLPGPANLPHKQEASAPASSHVVLLDPLLVNLADSSGTSYLRVALALQVTEEGNKAGNTKKEERDKDAKAINEALAPVRDTLLTVLGRQTSDQLLAPDGKDQLRAALKSALARRNPELMIRDVFFTDFLVQR